MKNIMKKNKNMIIKNKNMVSHLSSTTSLNMDEKIQKLKDLREERESLKSDLGLIGPAIKAASKISTGETPAKEDNESLEELKDNYSAFFDSEDEEENASSLLNKIMGVKRYLSKEIKTNKISINSLKEKSKPEEYSSGLELGSTSGSTSGSALGSTSVKSSSDLSKEFTIEKGESSKRKADDISDSEESTASFSSKKSRQSSNEEIDNWYYNPFDDFGTD